MKENKYGDLVLLPRVQAQASKFERLSNNQELKEMIQHFEKSMPQSLGMSGIELGKITGIKFDKWNEFLALEPIRLFIEAQTGSFLDAASRSALVNLGDADKSVDVQKVKAFADLKKSQTIDDRKPFNIYMFPAEVKKYKNALIEIKEHIESPGQSSIESIMKIINKVIRSAN